MAGVGAGAITGYRLSFDAGYRRSSSARDRAFQLSAWAGRTANELESHRRHWKQFKGSARQQWGRLTEDDLEVVAGKREHLAGMIQEAYGITREASEKQLSEWLARQHKTDPMHK